MTKMRRAVGEDFPNILDPDIQHLLVEWPFDEKAKKGGEEDGEERILSQVDRI